MSQLLSLIFLATTISFSAVADSDQSTSEQGPVTDLTDGQSIVRALIAHPEIGERLRK